MPSEQRSFRTRTNSAGKPYLVPEDRRKTGLVTSMALRENVTLPDLWRYANFGLISYGSELRTAP